MDLSKPYGWWLPFDASATGGGIDRLILIVHIFMALLFVGWGIYLIYVLVRFRARPGHSATPPTKPFRLPTWLEVGVALVEVVLLVFISSPLWYRYKKSFPAEKDAVVIRVVAEQFAWNLHYPGQDGRFGRVRPELVTDTNPIGLDREDPAGKDDWFTINELHVPTGRPVILKLTSKDVIHGFYLPVLRVKQDAIPGMTIPIWFEAAKPGKDFEIACAQLCGLAHYRMLGRLIIDTPEEFAAWQAQQDKELRESQS
jgi:cytochrome c oxidase subunit 2